MRFVSYRNGKFCEYRPEFCVQILSSLSSPAHSLRNSH